MPQALVVDELHIPSIKDNSSIPRRQLADLIHIIDLLLWVVFRWSTTAIYGYSLVRRHFYCYMFFTNKYWTVRVDIVALAAFDFIQQSFDLLGCVSAINHSCHADYTLD